MIGDTGLLDHLLKHLTDEVAAPTGERLRRRHNREGHMQYWLQVRYWCCCCLPGHICSAGCGRPIKRPTN